MAVNRTSRTPDYRLAVSISQRAVSIEVLASIRSTFGGAVRVRQRRNPNVALQAEWKIDRIADLTRFLTTIRPYARIKSPQIELALEYLRTRTLARVIPIHDARGRVKGMQPVPHAEVELRRSFYERMHHLNRVGPSVDVVDQAR